MARRRKSRRNAGFVLIEVLVAVGIAAVLMAVLMRAFINAWAGINVVRDEAEGTLMARSMLDEILMKPQLQAGTQEGTLGRYNWTISTSMQTVPTIAPPPKAPPAAGQQQTAAQAQGIVQGQPQQQQQQQQQAQGGDAKPAPTTAIIYHVAVVMRGPSGRSNRLDAIKFGQTQ